MAKLIEEQDKGPDDQTILEMEETLCRRYRLSRKMLYPALRHADFHKTYKDPARYWNVAAYGAFSGEVLRHKLEYEGLERLLQDFKRARELHRSSWATVVAGGLAENAADRTYRNHWAIAHRYCCAVADDYAFPEPNLLERFTAEEFEQFNAYLEYVSSRCRISAGKHVRQACARQLDDREKSHRAVQQGYLS
jgi:hypothetical protein